MAAVRRNRVKTNDAPAINYILTQDIEIPRCTRDDVPLKLRLILIFL